MRKHYKIGMLQVDIYSSTGECYSRVKEMDMFTHQKGWRVLRFVDRDNAIKVAARMKQACQNLNLIYDHNWFDEILHKGIEANTITKCNASTLVRECIIEGVGIDPGMFFTGTEVCVLSDTGLFEPVFDYVPCKYTPSGFYHKEHTPLEVGDILVTSVPGTTSIVIEAK